MARTYQSPRRLLARLVIGVTLLGLGAWVAAHRIWESRTDETLRHAKNVIASIRDAQKRYEAEWSSCASATYILLPPEIA